jgi:hypothetical protein
MANSCHIDDNGIVHSCTLIEFYRAVVRTPLHVSEAIVSFYHDSSGDFYCNCPNIVDELAGEPFPLLEIAYVINCCHQSWVHAPWQPNHVYICYKLNMKEKK